MGSALACTVLILSFARLAHVLQASLACMLATLISYHVDVDPQQPNLANDLVMGTVIGSTSNCTWAQYSSLGVCTQGKNISGFVRYICKNHTLISFTEGSSTDHSCGYTLNGTMLTGTYLNTYWVEELSHSPYKP